MLKHFIRHMRVSLRDTSLLLREFGTPLLFFFAAVIGGGLAYYLIAGEVSEGIQTPIEAIYLVLTMTFLQTGGSLPHSPMLQIFYFIFPVIGIGALAQGLTDFGILLFNRRSRSKEWEIAMATTINKHHILTGLGHLGFRVVQQLHDMGEDVVVIELDPEADLTAAVQKLGIPVISGDASRENNLMNAGVKRAKTIVMCIQNDALNLQTALKARSLNPEINVVIRIFDDDFAEELHAQFGFNALSGTAIAAPAFASLAAGVDITNPINIEGEDLSLARFTIAPNSELDGKTVGQIEDGYSVSIVLVRHDHQSDMHPPDSLKIDAESMLAVLGRPDKLIPLVNASK